MAYNYREVSLADITDALSDGLHKVPKFCTDGEYLFVNATNLENGRIVEKDKEKRTTYEEYCKYGVPLTERTILYSIDGTIGNIARYRGEKCVLGKGACYITVCGDTDVDYIYYQLQSPHFKNYIDLMSTGSTIRHISLKTMRNYTFPLPELDLQYKISSILRLFDSKIELNQRINNNLQRQIFTLFQAEYQHPKENEGWKNGCIGDVVNLQRGYDLPRDKVVNGIFPVAGSTDTIAFHSDFTTEPPCIVMGRSGNIGKPRLYLQKCWAHNTTLFSKEYITTLWP